jgi:arginase family enzyme
LEAGGFTSREIIAGVRLACEKGFAGFDVVEVSPDYDTKSGTTAVLAARLAAEAIACLAALRAGKVRNWEWRG